MSRRTPASAPEVPGLQVTAIIGTGGFADVFLVNEVSLHREVALKVLRNQPSASERQAFEAEAHVMAQLSSHPAIVPIYQIGQAADGRPFLTMEYCRGKSLAERYRQAPLPIAEALEIGIQVCAAVETAHRAGVLHRDIKPANILTTAFGAPKLSDFGIAHVLAETDAAVSGFSVPWSPPEAFRDDVPPDARSDVWSLGATLYTLLEGRSPFERSADNDTATLMDRILHEPAPLLARPDADDALRAVLARAMSDRLDRRQQTALALARALQEVQVGMRLPTTRIDVLDSSTERVAEDPDHDELTSVRPITVIHQTPSEVEDATLAKAIGTPSPPRPVYRSPQETAVAAPSGHGTPAVSPHDQAAAVPEPDPPAAPARRRLLIGVVVAAAAVAALLGGLALMGDDAGDQQEAERLDTGTVRAPVEDTVEVPAPASPTDLRGELQGRTAVFTWSAPDHQEGDTYRWTLAGDGAEPSYTIAETARAQVDVPPGRRACIVVTTVRSGQQSDPSPLGCAEAP